MQIPKKYKKMLSDITTQMKLQGYSDSGIKFHNTVFRMFIKHSINEGIRHIDRIWLSNFLERNYCDSDGTPKSRGVSNYFRSAELLSAYLENTELPKHFRTCEKTQNPIIYKLIETMQKDMHYSKNAIKMYIITWHQLAKYADDNGLSTFDPEWVEPLSVSLYGLNDKCLTKWQRNQRRAADILCSYSQTGTIAKRRLSKNNHPAIFMYLLDLLNEYKSEQMLANSTYQVMKYNLGYFAHFLSSHNINDIAEIEISIIQEYLMSIQKFSKSTVSMRCYTLRAVLGLAHKKGIIEQDILYFLQTPRISSGSTIPSFHSAEDLNKFLKCIDRDTSIGKRDFAIILLALRLGIRAVDIRNLQFDNIKWQECQIQFVQSKTGKEISLPLSEEVGNAIIDYLCNGRPNTESSKIFVRHLAPFNDLCDQQSFQQRMATYWNKACIDRSVKKHYGIHSLRHTLAKNLLEQQVSLPIISEILGHSSIDSTGIYLGIDTNQLRKCSLDIPESGDKNVI